MMAWSSPEDLKDWFQNVSSKCRSRPQDVLAATFLWISATLTYLYGTFQLIPIVVSDYSWICQLFGFAVPTLIFLGLTSNFILIRKRNSSIRNKMLIQPVIKPPPSQLLMNNLQDSSADSEYLIKERTKYIGQQFMAQPFGEEESWHICAACEIFVPPRAWHCDFCKTCILRRDHHCVFTMSCIGEENHCNFLGLIFYLGCGTSLATAVNLIHATYFTTTVWWMFIVKAFVPFYVILFDFSVMNMLSGINLLGLLVSWLVFLFYIKLAFKGQTSADFSRSVSRTLSGEKEHSYTNFKSLLGPQPFLRIIWPFHSVMQASYTPQNVPHSDDRDYRKGL